MKKLFLFAALAIVVSSCTSRLTDFTVISTKNVPLNSDEIELIKGDRRIQGVDKADMIFYIPLKTVNLKEAIDRAIESVPNCVGLMDGVVKLNSWWALLYGQSKYIVEGTPLIEKKKEKKPEEAATPAPAPQPAVAAVPAQNAEQKPSQTSLDQPGTNIIFRHKVKQGETLASIAKTYDVTISEIIKWNKLSSSSVPVGTQLIILIK